MGSSCFPPTFAREELCFLSGTKLVLGRTANDPPLLPKSFLELIAIMH